MLLSAIVAYKFVIRIATTADERAGRRARKRRKVMHQRMRWPGLEPGSVPWQGTILPLDHQR